MPKFSVTASELNNASATLVEDNSQFQNRVNELMNCASELSGMWQGEANVQFNNALQSDQARWTEFANLITQYAEALRTIAQTYGSAEEANVNTAVTRTY